MIESGPIPAVHGVVRWRLVDLCQWIFEELRISVAKLRRAVRTRGHFPTDDAALKLLFLVLRQVAEEWKMPPREWCEAKTQFAIMFDDRFVTA